MTQNQYDYIIIGAGQSDLTLSFGHPSPVGEGDAPLNENTKIICKNYQYV